MKQIIAIVRPHLAQSVVESLRMAPLEALTVYEVRGFGRQKSYLPQYDESEFNQVFLPKIEIVAWVEDFRAQEVIECIEAVTRTGRSGDGKIIVVPVDALGESSQQSNS